SSPSFSGSGPLGGLPVVASGTLQLKPGPAVTLFSSYEFVRHLSVEMQLGYSSTAIDRFSGTFSLPGAQPLQGGFPIRGNIESVAGFTNLVFNPTSDRDRIFPFIGAGIGFASSRASIGAVDVFGTSLPVSAKSFATSFAWDALVGADYRITEHGNLGLVYQFSRTNQSDLGSTSGFKATTGALNASIIAVLFEYRF
ncbi:MAG: outer membrane beta-barrel protein, partial [Acetobacteraceae bacterium]|nr:outer membrane beta-barrel protein [Acetobacteraceae bacterium]